jgi:PAS domain S-box-containing protein
MTDARRPDTATPSSRNGDDVLRLTFEEAGLATWDTDFRTRRSLWSPNHFRMFGYPVEPAGHATFEMWSSRLHPEDRPRVLAELRAARRNHAFYRSEYRIVRADTGEVVWVDSRGRFLYDSTGRGTRLVGICIDITARKQTEERLARREVQLDLATRMVGIGVFDHDHRTDRTWWSDRFRAIHDMPPDITPDIALLDAQLHPDDHEPLLAAVRAAHDPAGDGKFDFEYRIVRSNGDVRWIVARAQTIFEGEGKDRRPVRTVGAELDVTDRRLTETRLRESEQRFRTMADGSPVVIWAIDATGNIEFVNKAFFEFFGITPQQTKVANLRSLIHPDDEPAYVAAFEAAVPIRAPLRARTRVRAAGGVWRWIETYATPRIGPDGQFLGYVGVSPDVTLLVEAQETLREAAERKDEFLATLAHELRNPLAPIRTAAEMLTNADLTAEQVQWSRQVIHRQVEHMARLLDDLLDVARITRRKLELRKQRIDLGAVVDTAVEAARPLITARKHGLSIDLAPDLPTVEADPVRLAQVLSNLLTNAAKYTDPPGRIQLTARVEGGAVSISVKDNGIGLSHSMRGQIFEIFSQGEERGRAEGGLGIGLALVKGLVDLHGGTIEVFSDGPGCGSEFVVKLPCGAEGAASTAQPPAEESGTPTVTRRILVVDDNEDAANTLALLLRLAGHDVNTAHGGQAALTLAEALHPEFVLLDIGMPDLDGYEVARRLRATDWGKSLRLIALTGWGQDDDKRRALAAGFDHHLTKPVDPRELDSLLSQAA